MSETSVPQVNLLDLAACSLASSVSASISIRGFSRLNGEPEDIKNIQLKDDGSFVTDADFAAQCLITQAVQRISKHVRILGEENPDKVAQQVVKTSKELDERVYHLARKEVYMRCITDSGDGDDSTLPLSATNQTAEISSEEDVTEPESLSLEDQAKYLVDASRVSVIIDPLDGTKAFANSEYDAVSILIAIVLDRDPCFGVICKPFGYDGLSPILDTGCAAVYGGTLLGGGFVAGGSSCFLPVPATPEKPSDSGVSLPRAVISSSRSKGVVLEVCKRLASLGVIHPEPLHISGAGEKSLRLILRHNNEGLWFFPKAGTSLWDIAASEALLRATGGKVTDKFGRELDYTKSRDDAENADGIIACYDSNLHAECMRVFQEGEWADG